MKVRINFRRNLPAVLMIAGSILVLLSSLYFPWLSFTGVIKDVAYGTFEVSGTVFGFGIGVLNRTNARVTVWSSSTTWSSAGSDFWFGWLALLGGGLVLVCTLGLVRIKKPKTLLPLILLGVLLSITAFSLARCYKPQTFVVQGQINDYPINVGVIRAEDATITVGIGPSLSLVGGILSIIGMASATAFKSFSATHDDEEENKENRK